MGEDARILSITKLKDGATPDPLVFQLLQVTLPWKDDAGTPETSVVLIPTGARPNKGRGKPLSGNARLALEALGSALAAGGLPPPWKPDPAAPGPLKVVPRGAWLDEFRARHSSAKRDSQAKAFGRAVEELTRAGAVAEWAGHYWPTPSGSTNARGRALVGKPVADILPGIVSARAQQTPGQTQTNPGHVRVSGDRAPDGQDTPL